MSQIDLFQNKRNNNNQIQKFQQVIKRTLSYYNIRSDNIDNNFNQDYINESDLIKYLRQPHNTLNDGKNIYLMIKDYQFFQVLFQDQEKTQITEEKLYRICSKMQLERFNRGQVIFREGQQSNDKMYVIIQGHVSIVLLKPLNNQLMQQQQNQDLIDEKQQQKLEQQINLKRSSSNIQIASLMKASQNISLKFIQTLQKKPIDNTENITLKYGQQVNIISVGQQFGELALLAENSRKAIRSATCIALNNVYLISIIRDDFIEVVKQFKKENQDKLKTLREAIPGFDKIVSQQIIDNLIYNFKEEIYHRENNITVENITSQYLYVITAGEIVIRKNQKFIARINDNNPQILGEECLFNNGGLHEYTSTVSSSQLKVLKILLSSLTLTCPIECLEGLRNIYNIKFAWREQMIVKNEQQYIDNQKLMKFQTNGNLGQLQEISQEKQGIIDQLVKKGRLNRIKSSQSFRTKQKQDENSKKINVQAEQLKIEKNQQNLKNDSRVAQKRIRTESNLKIDEDIGIFPKTFKKDVFNRLIQLGLVEQKHIPFLKNNHSNDNLIQCNLMKKKIIRIKKKLNRRYLTETASLVITSSCDKQNPPTKIRNLSRIQIDDNQDFQNYYKNNLAKFNSIGNLSRNSFNQNQHQQFQQSKDQTNKK